MKRRRNPGVPWASIVGTQGFQPFVSLGWLVACVLIALFLQSCYYLARIRMGSWVRPVPLLRGMREALVMAFSSARSRVRAASRGAGDRARVRVRPAALDGSVPK